MSAFRLAVTLVATAATLSPGLAREGGRGRGNSHPGSAYGMQGGVSPELALANVYSGIYGLPYTYDRRHYDFNRCPPPSAASSQFYLDPACRR